MSAGPQFGWCGLDDHDRMGHIHWPLGQGVKPVERGVSLSQDSLNSLQALFLEIGLLGGVTGNCCELQKEEPETSDDGCIHSRPPGESMRLEDRRLPDFL